MTFDFLNPHESPEQMEHIVDPFLSAWMEKVSEYNLTLPPIHHQVTKQMVRSFPLKSETSSDWQPEITFTARIEEGIEKGKPATISQGFALSEGETPFVTGSGNNLHAFTYEVRDEQREDGVYVRTEHFLIVGSPSEDAKPESAKDLGLDEHRYLFKRVTTIPASSVGKPAISATNKSIEARHDTGSDFMSPVAVEDFLKTVNTTLQNAENQPDVQAFLKQQTGSTSA